MTSFGEIFLFFLFISLFFYCLLSFIFFFSEAISMNAYFQKTANILGYIVIKILENLR